MAESEAAIGQVAAAEDVVMGTEAGATAAGEGGAQRGGEEGEAAAVETATDGPATTKKAGAKGKAGKKASGGAAAGSKEGAGATTAASIAQPTFPLARVARIVKADREVEATSKDAIWTVAVATELFIKHLTDSAVACARMDKKKTVTYRELANAVDGQSEFFFLQDVIPQPVALNKAFERRKELEQENRARAVGLIIDEDSDAEEEAEEEEEEEAGQAEQTAAADVDPAPSVEPVAAAAAKSKKTKSKKTNGLPAAPTSDASLQDVEMQLNGQEPSDVPS